MRPGPVRTVVPRNQDVAMIVTSDSQNNLSNIATKNDFENKLASFYKSKSLTANAKVKAAVSTGILMCPFNGINYGRVIPKDHT